MSKKPTEECWGFRGGKVGRIQEVLGQVGSELWIAVGCAGTDKGGPGILSRANTKKSTVSFFSSAEAQLTCMSKGPGQNVKNPNSSG